MKKILSMLLALVMVLGMLRVSTMAMDDDTSALLTEIGLTDLSISRGGAYFWDRSVIPLLPEFDI